MTNSGILFALPGQYSEGLRLTRCKVLFCQIDPAIFEHLKEEMKQSVWSIDSCEGMLEMLRLLDNKDYDYVVLNLGTKNVEIHTRLGAIRALDKHPKIVLNVPESDSFLPSSFMLDYPLIKGTLTLEKLINATRGIS